MTLIGYIFTGAFALLACYAFLRYKRRYKVISRLGSVELSSRVCNIEINTVIIKKLGENSHYEKGLSLGGWYTTGSQHQKTFPLSDREIDEMISLLKTQQVFSVEWKKNSTIHLSIDGAGQAVKLMFIPFSWIDYTFSAPMDKDDLTNLLNMFESLKSESIVHQDLGLGSPVFKG